LAPVEVGQTASLVTPWRADEAYIAQLAQAEAARCYLTITMAVLDLPHQRAAVLGTATDQVPGTEEPNHATRGIALPKTITGSQCKNGVVDPKADPGVLLQAFLPFEPRIEHPFFDQGGDRLGVVRDPVLYRVRTSETATGYRIISQCEGAENQHRTSKR